MTLTRNKRLIVLKSPPTHLKGGLMPAQNIVAKWIDGLNSHDANVATSAYAEDTVIHSPFYPQPMKGRAALGKTLESFYKAFPDLHFRLNNALDKGSTHAVELVMTGTNSGPMEGLKGTPTGRRLELRMAIFSRTNAQGLIVEERPYYDTASFYQQLALK